MGIRRDGTSRPTFTDLGGKRLEMGFRRAFLSFEITGLAYNRMLIFAYALEDNGFAPSPMYPPQMPLASHVGRMPVRSMVV